MYNIIWNRLTGKWKVSVSSLIRMLQPVQYIFFSSFFNKIIKKKIETSFFIASMVITGPGDKYSYKKVICTNLYQIIVSFSYIYYMMSRCHPSFVSCKCDNSDTGIPLWSWGVCESSWSCREETTTWWWWCGKKQLKNNTIYTWLFF